MAANLSWEKQIGRRLRLRDLHVFFTVVQHGSMAKAAAEMGVSQPSVSELISGLEHTLGVRLFDRSPHGVAPTVYGDALLTRGLAAFDELRQGIRDIEFLADPTGGEVTLGCSEAAAPGLLPPIIQSLSRRYPRVSLKVTHITANPPDLRGLDDRRLDLVMGPVGKDLPARYRAETLLNDRLLVVAGANSPWARRRRIEIAELAGERWILTPPDTPTTACIIKAFRASGLPPPRCYLETYSIHLRNHLISTGRFVGVMTSSVVRLNARRFGLVALPVELPAADFSLAVITVKDRTLTPVVKLFLECAREAAKSIE
jgi:DNA-binding transcriptional LysR family regulator